MVSWYILRIPILGFTLFLLCSKINSRPNSQNAFVRFNSNLREFQHLELEVSFHLTQAFLSSNSLPRGSHVRWLVELYLQDFYQTNGYSQIKEIIHNVDTNVLETPFCVHRLLRRIKIHIQELILLQDFRRLFGTLWRRIVYLFWRHGWLKYEDLELTSGNILKLQTVNDVDAEQFATHFVSGVPMQCKLNSVDCYEIANAAIKTKQYISAIEWLEFAQEKALVDKKVSVTFIEYLSRTAFDEIQNENLAKDLHIRNSVEPEYSKYSFVKPNGLTALVKFEWNIYPYIKHKFKKCKNHTTGTFTEVVKNNHDDVKMYLADFEDTTGKLVGNSENANDSGAQIIKVSENPLSAYRVTLRFREFLQRWAELKTSWEDPLMSKITPFLNKVYNLTEGPSEFDFESTLFAIINIQFVNDLSAKNISAGYVNGVNANITLKAKDCFWLGKYGISLNLFTIGIDWLEQALYLVKNTSDTSVSYENISQELAVAEKKHDEGCRKVSDLTMYFAKPLSRVRDPSRRITRKKLQYRALKIDPEMYLETKFCAVCNGRIRQTEKMKSKLFCWYEREIHPGFKIGPIKAELHSMHPKVEVVQYYDIIGARAIEALQNFSYFETLGDATMELYMNKKQNPLQRVGLYPYGNRNDHEAASRAAKIITRITGLKTRVDEHGRYKLRVSAYTPGRYVGRHFDKATTTHLATFIFYLSDISVGGETAFVDAGVKIAPRKGSAILWYNQFSCGTINPLTDHGACPAIFGTKWIGLLEIFTDQQNHYQCNLRQNTVQEILVNGKSKYRKVRS